VETKQVKKKTDLKVASKINLFDKNIIRLYKDIGEAQAEEIVSDLLKLDSIKDKKDITFYINSPGGNISHGLAIYDTMKMIKSDIKTICIGRCASMAAILLSGGTKGKRFITPNSEVMIHEVSTVSMGKIGDVKVNFEHTTKMNECMIKLLSDNTGQSIEQIKNDILKDKWFNAEEAIEYGLVDKVLTKNEI